MHRTPLLFIAAVALACVDAGRGTADSGSARRSAVASLTAASALVREEVTVHVGAAPERWTLQWRHGPRPACGPDDVGDAITCPCNGFAYGEKGELDLLRRRPGRIDERLALTPLFVESESPAADERLATLQRWPMRDSDFTAEDPARLSSAIRSRPVSAVMVTGDYDHDGRATEFLLQVETLPCGKRQSVLVGVSAADSSLHAFASVAHVERPLVLPTLVWEALRRSGGRVTAVEWACGDHASDTQLEITVSASASGIDGTRSQYACTPAGARGPLLSSTRL